MNNHIASTHAVDWHKVAGKTVRITWAFTLLILKFMLILGTSLATFMLSLISTTTTSDDTDRRRQNEDESYQQFEDDKSNR